MLFSTLVTVVDGSQGAGASSVNSYYPSGWQPQEHQQQHYERQQTQPYADQPPAVTASLPEGWSEHLDPASGEYYYYNAIDGTTTWDRPVPVSGNANATNTEGADVDEKIIEQSEERWSNKQTEPQNHKDEQSVENSFSESVPHREEVKPWGVPADQQSRTDSNSPWGMVHSSESEDRQQQYQGIPGSQSRQESESIREQPGASRQDTNESPAYRSEQDPAPEQTTPPTEPSPQLNHPQVDQRPSYSGSHSGTSNPQEPFERSDMQRQQSFGQHQRFDQQPSQSTQEAPSGQYDRPPQDGSNMQQPQYGQQQQGQREAHPRYSQPESKADEPRKDDSSNSLLQRAFGGGKPENEQSLQVQPSERRQDQSPPPQQATSRGPPVQQHLPPQQPQRPPLQQSHPPQYQGQPRQQQGYFGQTRPGQQYQVRPGQGYAPPPQYPSGPQGQAGHPRHGQNPQYGQPQGFYGQYDAQGRPMYGEQRPSGQLVVPDQNGAAPQVRQALDRTWKNILGWGNRTKEIAIEAKDNVSKRATEVSAQVSETSMGKYWPF